MSAGNVLLLDDDHGSCLMLRKMIVSLGYSVDVVHNVADGLRAASCKTYRVVIVDCFMPDYTGWVATRAIKLLPRCGPPPAVIGILSYPDEHLQQRCETSEMEGVLVKPFCKGAVVDCLWKVRPPGQNSHFPSSCASTSAAPLETGIVLKRGSLRGAHRERSESNTPQDVHLGAAHPDSMMLHEIGELNSL
jgi:CheY-like chemotaxis protein